MNSEKLIAIITMQVVVFLPTCCVGVPYNPIGTSYFIPFTRLLGEDSDMIGGYQIFSDMPSECLISTNYQVTSTQTTFYTSTEQFYSSLATESSISTEFGTEFTFGATLQAIATGIDIKKSSIAGITFQGFSKIGEDTLQQACILNTPLDNQFIKDFEKLPVYIETPWNNESWSDYWQFLKMYGTHVVTDAVYGCSYYIHVLADVEYKYSQEEFEIKACAELGGPDIHVGICSGVTQKEIDALSRMVISSKFIARGGTIDTQAKLHSNRSDELITKFLEEANATHQPIQYRFTPIWDILSDYYQKKNKSVYEPLIMNLQAFFRGYLNYGCTYMSNSGTVLRKFAYKTNPGPTFQCILAPQGCQNDDECHYRNVGWCECRGCVQYQKETLPSGRVKEYAILFEGSDWRWPGCGISGSGTSCACKKPETEWTVVWEM